MPTRNPIQKRGIDRKYVLLAFRMIGEFGAIIAVPVVALAILGRYLDARYGTGPAFLIGGFAIAAVLSGYSVYRKARAFGKEFEDITLAEEEARERMGSPKNDPRDRASLADE